MARPDILAGESVQVTLPATGGPINLAQLMHGVRLNVRAKVVTIYAPDGLDPGIAANTVTIFVGPNKSASFPLRPGASIDIEDANPYDIGFDARGTANQLAFVVFGGQPAESG